MITAREGHDHCERGLGGCPAHRHDMLMSWILRVWIRIAPFFRRCIVVTGTERSGLPARYPERPPPFGGIECLGVWEGGGGQHDPMLASTHTPSSLISNERLLTQLAVMVLSLTCQ